MPADVRGGVEDGASGGGPEARVLRGAGGRLSPARVRHWLRMLPAESAYSLEDVAGCDPLDKGAEPGHDVWPASVAHKLNERLGTDYPVRFRVPERESGRSR